MKRVYPVVLTKNEGVVLVEVPDLEILTQGEDLADAIDMARDAIGLKIITMEDDGEAVPVASDMAEIDIRGSEFYEEGNSFVTLVDIDVAEYRRKNDNKMVRRNVTLPNWMNVAAEKEGLNVSKVLQEALREKLEGCR